MSLLVVLSRYVLQLVLYLTCGVICQLAGATQLANLPVSSKLGTPNEGPTQFLIVSSPSLGKVVYTLLRNFESTEGRAYALVSSGLTSPMGLAFDKKNGYLYIADQAVPAIYRYQVYADGTGAEASLVTSGYRLTIMKGHPVQWLTLDADGNLFYTAPDTNDIMKIDAAVIHKVGNGEFKYSGLQIMSEKTVEAENQAKKSTADEDAIKGLPNDAPAVQPQILSLYEAQYNPMVSSPAGLWADGSDLYWTNTEDGKKAGTIVKGKTDPSLVNNPNGTNYFAAEVVTKASAGAYNIAKVGNTIFFSQNGTTKNSGLISALLTPTGDVMPIVSSLSGPRGIVWDGDQTLFVADEVGGNVWCFPSGRFMKDPPLQKVVGMQGAYGLAMLSEAEPWHAKSTINLARSNTYAANSNMRSLSHRASHISFTMLGALAGVLFRNWF